MADSTQQSEQQATAKDPAQSISTPATTGTSKGSKAQQHGNGQGGQVKLVNLTSRNIELDFGRNQEIRICAYGESIPLPASIVESQQYLREARSLMAIPA